MAISKGSAWIAGTGLRFASSPAYATQTLSTFVQPTYIPSVPAASPAVSPATPPVVAGIEPQAYEAILYGKDIPLFVGGKMLIGGRICEGPYFGGTQAEPTVSFVAYHAQSIIPELISHTAITQARLRGQEVWNSTSGYIATDKVPAGSFAWNPGHVTNIPFPQSVARQGDGALGYTMGITSSWEDIPLRPFGGIVPFPSVLVENSTYGDPADGITRTQALKNILQHMGLYSFEYEVDVSGSDPAWMVGSSMTLLSLLQQLRAIFTKWQITYTDKLRIIEPAQFSVKGELTNSNVVRDSLKFKRTDPLSLTREKRYTYIDVDRDYEMNIAVAKEDRYPVPTTDATQAVSIELPIATTAAQAIADIHNSLYEELSVRSQMEATSDRTLMGLECGDGVRFRDSSVIDMTARVMEAVHDFENWNVQIQAGEVLKCDANADPDIDSVVILIGFNKSDGSTDFVDEGNRDKTLSFTAPAAMDTAQKRFGEASGLFDGVTAVMGLAADDPDMDLPASWTFECWARWATVANDKALFGAFNPPNDGYMLRYNAGTLAWHCFAGTNFTGSFTPVADTWYAIAIARDGTTTRLYVDGVMIGSTTGPQDGEPTGFFGIGAQANGGLAGRYFNGWVDEFRYSHIDRFAGATSYAVTNTQFPRPL